jgi:anti-sigma factor RsiW
MNCKAFESLIALYIEGDLSASDLSRVVCHLDGCAACRYFADDMRESQSMFKSLRAGTVNSAELADVRQRVLNEVGDLDPAPGWVVTMHRLFFAGLRRRNAIAGALVAALITGSVWYSETRIVHELKSEAPVDVAKFEAPAPVDLPYVVQRSVAAPRIVKRAEPLELTEVLPEEAHEVHLIEDMVPLEPQVSRIPMKFVTDDPDIIIYWLPTDKGD